MGYHLRDGFFIATRITGPTHNFLGLKFCDRFVPPDDFVFDVIENEEKRITREQVTTEVMAGLELVNRQLETNYHIKEIRVFSDDSPTVGVYGFLTRCIVYRLYRFPNDYVAKGSRLELPPE